MATGQGEFKEFLESLERVPKLFVFDVGKFNMLILIW